VRLVGYLKRNTLHIL